MEITIVEGTHPGFDGYGYFDFACTATFGCNYDNPISTSRTVDSRRGCIFENSKAFYILRIELSGVIAYNDAINDP